MAKLNSPFKMQRARNARLRSSGQCTGSTHHRSDGRYISHYSQGCYDFDNGVSFNPNWHIHRQQGWKKQQEKAALFFKQTGILTGGLKLAA